MKKWILSSMLLVISFTVFSQTDIIASFNSIDTGRNVALSIKKDSKNHSFLLGVKYNINRIIHDNQNNVFRKRFYATNFWQHFGFILGYQYNIPIESFFLEPFVFYDLQFLNSHTRNLILLPYDYDVNGDVLYKQYLEFFGPTIALEHNLGLGVYAKINEDFFLHQRIGAGVATFYNVDKRNLGPRSSWEFGYIISVGLGYHF